MYSFFSITKGAGFWGRRFEVTCLIPMLFSLEGSVKKKKPREISIFYNVILLIFLLPLWAKIFTGLVKNGLTSIICSTKLGILLFKIQNSNDVYYEFWQLSTVESFAFFLLNCNWLNHKSLLIWILLTVKIYSAKLAVFRFVNRKNLFRKNFCRSKFLPLDIDVYWYIGINDFLSFSQIWLPNV